MQKPQQKHSFLSKPLVIFTGKYPPSNSQIAPNQTNFSNFY